VTGPQHPFQSDTRIGTINTVTGEVRVCPPVSGGAYFPRLRGAKFAVTLTGGQLMVLKAHVAASSNKRAGTAGVLTDNGGAIRALG
jgi:hypothetical protein